MNKNILKITLLLAIFLSGKSLYAQKESAESIVSKMTFEEKCQQMMGIHDFMTYNIRGTMEASITGKNRFTTSGENKKLGVPAIKFCDGPKGANSHGKHTIFPSPVGRGAAFDKELENRVGVAIGQEVAAAGANYFGGVTLNMITHPQGGRSEEWYGEDPVLIGLLGVQLTKGVQKEHKVMACAKHFVAFELQNNMGENNAVLSERTLREIFLEPFRRQVEDAHVASIMPSYNKVNGVFAGDNKYLLEIPRKEWGWKGFYLSDFMFCINDGVKAIKAGHNIEMPFDTHYAKDSILSFKNRGLITDKEIDDLILPTVRAKMEYGENKEYKLAPEVIQAHRNLSQEVAEKGMVLLKNEGALPLDVKSIKKVLVVGDLAKRDNFGDYLYNPDYRRSEAFTPLEGIRNYLKGSGVSVTYTDGKDKDVLYKLGLQNDVIIVCMGRTDVDQTEKVGNFNTGVPIQGMVTAGDRSDLDTSLNDQDVIRTTNRCKNAKRAIVYFGASATVTTPWENQAQSIIFAGFPGMYGGKALANVLFGKVNPSGKLSYTILTNESDYPKYPWDPRKKATTKDGYDPYVTPYDVPFDYYTGYTLADKKNLAVSYPFGFGLSYTKFKIDGIASDKTTYGENDVIKVKCTVKNIGQRQGGEVVQVYAGFANAKVDRPVKALKNFEKVYLEPNASSVVEITIPVKDLAYWDVASQSWKVEKITYPLYIGNSSRLEDLQKVEISVN